MATGFLLAEDAAVKQRFSNLTVTDNRNNERSVGVFFRYPEGETEKEYPFITVENVSLVHATNRQHSEMYYYYTSTTSASATDASVLNYYPSELSAQDLSEQLEPNGYLRTEAFVPVDLVYQVTTHCRSALHDRQLSAKILTGVVPFRRGYINVEADGTSRRFDLLGWTNADVLDNEAGYRKRVFRKIYTIRMNAEIPTYSIVNVKQVSTVIGNIQSANNSVDTVTPTFSEDF